MITAPPDSDLALLRAKAIEEMKAHTRQYVLRQLSWIKHKLIPLCIQTNRPIYILDATDPTKWSENVLRPALEVSRAFASGNVLPEVESVFARAPELLRAERETSMPSEWRHWKCDICADKKTEEPYVLVGGEKEWQGHLKSRSHKSRERGRRKRAAFEEWKARHAEQMKVNTHGVKDKQALEEGQH